VKKGASDVFCEQRPEVPETKVPAVRRLDERGGASARSGWPPRGTPVLLMAPRRWGEAQSAARDKEAA
jgi:hypothetical protein